MKPRLPELLAPAGDEAAFRCALAGGADAIYCGLDSLNARRGATNFTDEAFERCCRLAHLLGVRVYLTLNVAIKESELEGALRLAEHATELGADALIIQDLGLLAALHERHPSLELHVSTQANVHDARGVLWCGERGASRVTLSRELSLAEIREICAAGAGAGVGCEVFCHGALCMSYSGLCLMSSLRGRRSANRGLCAQPCRLPHRLLDGAGRPLTPEETRALCPKDLSATAELPDLVAAGVASLKIEGRMKAPDYVLSVTRAWREALDALEIDGLAIEDGVEGPRSEPEAADFPGRAPSQDEAGAEGIALPETATDGDPTERITLPSEALDRANHRLKRAFNRDFTTAYLHGRSGPAMMSPERSNNRGALVGEVVAAKGNRVTVLLEDGVGEGDLLELRPPRNPDRFLTVESPRAARAGERLELRLKRPLPVGVPVRALREARALADAKAAGHAEYPRRRQVRIAARAVLGEPLEITLMTRSRTPEERAAHGDVMTVKAEGPVVEPARTKELTAPDLADHTDRLGTTPFIAVDVDAHVSEGAGLSFSTIHRLRAQAVESLQQTLLAPYRERSTAIRREADLRPPSSPRSPAATSQLATPSDTSRPSAAAPIAPQTCSAVDSPVAPPEPASDPDSETLQPPVPSAGAPTSRHRGVRADAGTDLELCCLVGSPEAVLAAQEAGAARIYALPDVLQTMVSPGEPLPDAVIPWLDEVCREPDHPRIDPFVRSGEPCVASNVSELALAQERGAAFEVGIDLPIFNRATISLLESCGARALWLSPELSQPELATLAAVATVPCGVVVSGALRAMTTEHCVLQQAGRCLRATDGSSADPSEDPCARCPVAIGRPIPGHDPSSAVRPSSDRDPASPGRPTLENIDARRLPVTSAHGRSRIWWNDPLDLVPHLAELRTAGLHRLLVDARLMTPEEVSLEVKRVTAALAGTPHPRRPHTTLAHYLHPVD